MASYNRVVLVGNLTRNPELRYIASGTAVTDIGIRSSGIDDVNGMGQSLTFDTDDPDNPTPTPTPTPTPPPVLEPVPLDDADSAP